VAWHGKAAPNLLTRRTCAAQVRSTGPINAQTHQPIKGRKFGGGIRFGEMERDALLVGSTRTHLHSDSDGIMNAHPAPEVLDKEDMIRCRISSQ